MNPSAETPLPDPGTPPWSPQLYNELRQLAAALFAREHAAQTLQATALVHEAWLRLGADQQQWKSRAQFFAAAAEAMRRILIDQARRRAAQRRGGDQERVELIESQIVSGAPDEELLAVHEALERFAAVEPEKAELVKLRYFVGLRLTEAAAILEISEATAKRYWAFARAWLYREITAR